MCPGVVSQAMMMVFLTENVLFSSGRVLDVWLDKMPCVTQPDKKKLLSLALCSLLPLTTAANANSSPAGTANASSTDVVRDRVFGILASVTEVLNDVTRTDEDTGAIIE